jgi:hypothetical protein
MKMVLMKILIIKDKDIAIVPALPKEDNSLSSKPTRAL